MRVAAMIFVLVSLFPHISKAEPIMAGPLVGLGPTADIEAYIQPIYFGQRRSGRLLANITCLDPQCITRDSVDGVLDADLFDVEFAPDAQSGTWSFDGYTEIVNPSVRREWFVRLVAVHLNFGTHVSHELYGLTEPGDPGFLIDLFSGGPIEWSVDHPVPSSAGLSFYGGAARVPEPALPAQMLIGAGMAAAWLRRRRSQSGLAARGETTASRTIIETPARTETGQRTRVGR
jgi:hypothetical protein